MLPIWGIIGAIATLSTEKTRKKATSIRKNNKLPIGFLSAAQVIDGVVGTSASVLTSVTLSTWNSILKQIPKIIEAKKVIGAATYTALTMLKERSDTPAAIKKMILLIENPSPELPGVFMQQIACAYGKKLAQIRGDLASVHGVTSIPSQSDFAQSVGVSRPVINGLEGKNYIPEFQTLVQIHHYLDLIASTDPAFKKKYDEKLMDIINEALAETEKVIDAAKK